MLKALAKNPEERYADMGELQAALKSSGGFQVPTVPDPAGRRTLTARVASRPHDTTFTTGTGERVNDPPPRADRGVGGKAALVFGLLVVAGGGYFVLAGRKSEAPVSAAAPDPGKSAATSAPAATGLTPRPVDPVAQAKPAATKLPAGREPVTLRISSQPAGATVVDGAGQSLGVTPLVLTRPRGSALDLRVRKEGYQASARTVSLTADQTVELTLERDKPAERARPKHAVHKTHDAPPSEEPAKL